MGKFAFGKAGLALAGAAFVAALAACSNRPESSASGPASDPDLSGSLAIRDGFRLQAAQGAADFHASLAALDRIAGLMASAADTAPIAIPAAALRGYGYGPAAPEPLAGQPSTLAALIKSTAPARPTRLGPAPHGRLALGKRAASEDSLPDVNFEGDTSWYNYADSARGQVHWIHVYRDPDWGVLSIVRDSLSYRWPSTDSSPALISSSTIMTPFYGSEFRLVLDDEDGDGLLHSARQGAAVRIRKEWRETVTDTVRKSVWHYDHGAALAHGGVDEGAARSFTDTLWIKGKVVGWTLAGDGDGDGLALTTAPGRAMVVKTEAFTAGAGGQRIFTRITAGAGPDDDWFTAGDNAWVAYGRTLISAAGDTLFDWEAGDADGDGFYFDPAAHANLVWETHRYPCGRGCAGYQDSVVKSLGDLADGGDDRIAFALARLRWDDGSESTLRTTPRAGQGDFGAGDTADAQEIRSWRGIPGTYVAAGEADSLVRTFRLAVGDLADASDDRASVVSLRAWYGAGAFWRETTETRQGPGLAYTAALSGGRRAAGAYDAEVGRFEDTLFLADGGRDIHAGTYSTRDGSAEYEARRQGLAPLRVKVERFGRGFAITSSGEGDTARYAQQGDTASWIQASAAGPIFHTAVYDGEGGYRLTLAAVDRDAMVTAEGAFRFAADGTGNGWVGDAVGGSRGEFLISADGKAVSARISDISRVARPDPLAAKP